MTRLGDVGKVITGNTPKTSDSQNYASNDICFVKPSDIADGTVSYLDDTEFYISEYARAKARVLPPKSVLVTCIGIIGKVAINNVECAFNQQINAIIPNTDKCLTEYLAYAIQNKQTEMQDIANAPVVPILNKTQFSDIEIKLPFLSEQMDIVKKLNAVSKLIALRKEQLAKLDQLVKSRFIELFGDPETNPMGWKCVTVQQAINEKIIDKPLDGNHGGKHPKTSDYVPKGVPFIMANNLVDGRVDMEHCAFITEKQADSLDKGFAKDGDVLITHKGTIGRTAILHCTYPYIMLTPQVTYYRPISGIIPEYLKAYFDTDYFQGVIGNIASVGSTRAYIGITAQQELPLLIPAMDRQREYAAFVEQTDKSKLAIQQSLDKLELLKESLMQEYFG